jgi:hypothetical protein
MLEVLPDVGSAILSPSAILLWRRKFEFRTGHAVTQLKVSTLDGKGSSMTGTR